MDLSQKFINQLLSSLWWFIPLVFFLVIIKSPFFKGWFGEFIVNFSTNWFLDRQKYHLIKNVILPTNEGTTQIDHIIVSIFGIFVVETKNMKGWIFGGANQKIWTQKIYNYSNKFQNPIHQNYKHVKTLQSLLGLNENQIYSVIVFVGDSKFKTEMPENVTYAGGYLKYIKSKNTPVLTQSQVKEIISIIKQIKLNPSIKTYYDHKNHVKDIIAKKEKELYNKN